MPRAVKWDGLASQTTPLVAVGGGAVKCEAVKLALVNGTHPIQHLASVCQWVEGHVLCNISLQLHHNIPLHSNGLLQVVLSAANPKLPQVPSAPQLPGGVRCSLQGAMAAASTFHPLPWCSGMAPPLASPLPTLLQEEGTTQTHH